MVVIRCEGCDRLVNRDVNSRCPYCKERLPSYTFVARASSVGGTPETGVRSIRREYDWATTRPSVAIVQAIADLEGAAATSPALIDGSVGDYLDCDAMDAFVRSAPRVSVSFTVSEYRVRIDGETLVVRSYATGVSIRSRTC